MRPIRMRWRPGGTWRIDERSRRPAARRARLAMAGLWAYRRTCGTSSLFRPLAHTAGIRRACRDHGIPPVPDALLVRSAEEIVRAARTSIPDGPLDFLRLPVRLREDGSGGYDCEIGAIAQQHRHDLTPVTLRLSDRACWVDDTRHPFFVIGRSEAAQVITPVLPGGGPAVARDTVLKMSRILGFPAREVDLSLESWRYLIERETVTEAFTCHAGPMVAPVSVIEWSIGKVRVGNGQPGYVTINVHRALLRLVRGAMRDEHGWNHIVR